MSGCHTFFIHAFGDDRAVLMQPGQSPLIADTGLDHQNYGFLRHGAVDRVKQPINAFTGLC